MQTSPILNPANIAPAPASGGKQNGASAPDVPFNQVLSREMSEQRESAPKETSKPTNDQPQTNATAPEAGKPVDEKPKADADSAPEDDQTAAAAAASAEILALVANASQAVAPADSAKPAADATLAVGTDGAGKRKLPIGASVPAAKPAAAAPVDTQAGKEAASKAGMPFAATTDKSETARTQLDAARTADAKAALPAPELDLAAKTREKPAELSVAALQPMQQAAFGAIQAASGQTSDKLTPPVGTPAWDQALGQKVAWMVAGDQQSATLTLNPPDLGPLQVVLNVSNSHADATFVAAQPEVRQALEAAMPKLRDMLGDAGIQLGQATVSAGTPNQHNAPGERHAQAPRHAGSGDGRGDAPVRVGRVQPASSGQGLVDTFA